MKTFIKGFSALLLVFAVAACDLDEELNDSLTSEEAEALLNANADVQSLLRGAYEGLRTPFMDQAQVWAAQEHTSDEVMGPTRGPDWDDNGVWRVLHNHRWAPDHQFLEATFNGLLQVVFSTTNILTFDEVASAQELAEARFIRAFVVFTIADGWGQVPFREAGDNLLLPPTVFTGGEAMDLVISELEAIIPDLPDGPAITANKDGARALLMKAYLNRGIIGGKLLDDGSINTAVIENTNNATFFPQVDMNTVVDLANAIESSPRAYTLADNYFDNFAPNNDQISTENIWTGLNEGGANSGNVRSRWFCTLHYNQNPSGWNGFCTIADFYNKFDANDERIGGEYAGQTEVAGINVGFLVGQQVDQDGNALEDRRGNPLVFTPEIDLQEAGEDLEVRGIRVIKYPIDYNGGDNADNDYVFLRYADVRLMKAEAILRGATNATESAADIVNEIRTKRGLDPLATVDLDALLDERGRELYWEGHRRTDLIRFGQYINATWDDKDQSDPFRVLFPIPANAVAVNPNLTQNPGYEF